jgi:hypothetical protein
MKKLFADPHYNVMDGLDTYIDDYNTPDPIPAAMFKQLVQARMLGLLDDELEDQVPAAGSAAAAQATDVPPVADADPDQVLAEGAAGYQSRTRFGPMPKSRRPTRGGTGRMLAADRWRKSVGVEPTWDRRAAPPGFADRTPHRGTILLLRDQPSNTLRGSRRKLRPLRPVGQADLVEVLYQRHRKVPADAAGLAKFLDVQPPVRVGLGQLHGPESPAAHRWMRLDEVLGAHRVHVAHRLQLGS